jgi:hypothetical protein
MAGVHTVKRDSSRGDDGSIDMPSKNLATELYCATELELPRQTGEQANAIIEFVRMLLNQVTRLSWCAGFSGTGGVLIILAVLTIVHGGQPPPTPTPTPIPF